MQPFDPILKAPRFSNAGTSVAFSPDESGVTSFSLFDQIPAYQDLKAKGLAPAELIKGLRRPDVRLSIESWIPESPGSRARREQAYRST